MSITRSSTGHISLSLAIFSLSVALAAGAFASLPPKKESTEAKSPAKTSELKRATLVDARNLLQEARASYRNKEYALAMAELDESIDIVNHILVTTKKRSIRRAAGSVFRSVWKLAWPVALLQLVSGMHGFVDQILVGHYVGYAGNAGVGVSWQLFLVILVSLNSLFHGMGIVIARYAGRKEADQVNRVVYEVFLASCGGGALSDHRNATRSFRTAA